MRKRTLTLLLILGGLVLVVGVVAIYGLATHRMLYVPSGSMMNTVIPGDRLFARRVSEIKRGQVVVFQYPGDSTFYLARVIGLPSETLEIRETDVYINNRRVIEQKVMVDYSDPHEPLKEISTEGKGRYRVFYELDVGMREHNPQRVGPHQIPAGHYFVMGDNRDNSEDSRYRGPVPRERIWGEAFMIYFSTTVKTSEYRSDRWFKRIN